MTRPIQPIQRLIFVLSGVLATLGWTLPALTQTRPRPTGRERQGMARRHDVDTIDVTLGADLCDCLGGRATICHQPTTEGRFVEMSVACHTLPNHLAHGDWCGTCACERDSDCGNGPPGSLSFCSSGSCRFFCMSDCVVDAACDDGIFCNGIETCVDMELDGPCSSFSTCVAAPAPCDDWPCEPGLAPLCHEEDISAECTCVECVTDADCDDGVFCNGAESCSRFWTCVAGGDPCADTTCPNDEITQPPVCNEMGDACICLQLSADLDDLTGTAADDEFFADLAITIAAFPVATLQTRDRVDGLEGFDTLYATFNPVSTAISRPRLTSIEQVTITHLGTSLQVLDALDTTGLERIVSTTSTNDIDVISLNSAIDVGFSNQTTPMTMTLEFDPTAVLPDDIIEVSLNRTRAASCVIVHDGATGFGNFVVHSTGNTGNELTQLTQIPPSATSLMIFGNRRLQLDGVAIAAIDAPLTINATALTADLTLGTGTTADTFAPAIQGRYGRVDLGPGDDTVVLGGALSGDDFTDGPLDCGAGSDTVQRTIGGGDNFLPPLVDCENLRLHVDEPLSAGSDVDLRNVLGLERIVVDADGFIADLPLVQGPSAATKLQFEGRGVAEMQTYAIVTHQALADSDAVVPLDILSVTVTNRGTVTPLHDLGRALRLESAVNLSIKVADGPAVVDRLVIPRTTALQLSPSPTIDLGVVETNGLLTLLDASGGLTAQFSGMQASADFQFGNGADRISFIDGAPSSLIADLGEGDDEYTADPLADTIDIVTGGAGDDVIMTGAGDDTIVGGMGQDVVTGGPGSDVFVFDQQHVFHLMTVQDFEPGLGGDVLSFDAVALGLSGHTVYIGPLATLPADGSASVVVLTNVSFGSPAAVDFAIATQVEVTGRPGIVIYFDTALDSGRILHDPDFGAAANPFPQSIGRLLTLDTMASMASLVPSNIGP